MFFIFNYKKIKILHIFFTIAISFIFIFYFINIYLPSNKSLNITIKYSIQRILFSQVMVLFNNNISHIGGELFEQNEIIKRLSIDERVNFYIIIIANINLSSNQSDMIAYLEDIIYFDAIEINYCLKYLKLNGSINKFNDNQKNNIYKLSPLIDTISKFRIQENYNLKKVNYLKCAF